MHPRPNLVAAGRVPYDAPGVVIVELPIVLVSEANQRGTWQAHARRRQGQRRTTARVLRALASPLEIARGLAVTITRIAPGALDSDNLVGSAKHVRDGVADWLGIDDRSRLVTWHVQQERRGVRVYGVRIRVVESIS